MTRSCKLLWYLVFQLAFVRSIFGRQTRVPLKRITGKFVFPFTVGSLQDDETSSTVNAPETWARTLNAKQQVFARVPAPQEEERSGSNDDLSRSRRNKKYSVIYQLMYITDLSIGTPPQPFRAIVDITQSNLFVPSWNCTTNPHRHEVEYCLFHLMYDSAASSTYKPELTPATFIITAFILGEIYRETTSALYDSALGLARFHATNLYNDFNVASPLENMVQQKVLNRNIFALKHPRTDDEEGELILGGADESFVDSLITLPLINTPADGNDLNFIAFASAGWQVAASSLSLDSYLDNGPLQIPLPNYIAVLTNGYTNMMFPRQMAHQIAEHLDWTDWLDDFSCEKRHSFPNVTIALGPQQHRFVLSPWQYMHEVVDPEGRKRCTLPFHPLVEDGEHPNYILLGAAFLASWYAEFDLDKETIGLAYRDDY
ncbi:acid protease [Zopfia rhizophila CBS 207.26]|uniref:Acid protease n=1 Tax=Zopfia rhizophila CBS 207.26 TaxID=1314779 RepID=A0A6A6D8H2_9PEZI|nr:acid protease [Zopfia rhizophila CBS 207.26]